MRRLLIDGDILIYQIATQKEEAINWGDDFWTLHCDVKKCKAEVDKKIDELLTNLNAKRYVVALTDKHNFRKDVLPSYKSNRKAKRKPMVLGELRAHVLEKHNAVIYPNLEADDVLGILATEPSKEEQVIVSIDKDLKQIPALVSTDGQTTESVTQEQADFWFMTQVLAGDSTDGYTGVPKVGIKTAEKILGPTYVPLLDMWTKVLDTYLKAGFTKKEAIQQARCARILRHTEYDLDKGQVKLWTL